MHAQFSYVAGIHIPVKSTVYLRDTANVLKLLRYFANNSLSAILDSKEVWDRSSLREINDQAFLDDVLI